MTKKSSTKGKSQRSREQALLKKVHLNAAGIDVGADTHWVAVPEDRDERPVRSFGAFTSDLIALCIWLKGCQIQTVAMESTGVYWIALYQMLEREGFEVRLVNASHVKNVPGRKTDVKDCQWLQQLHTFGMLRGSFRPEAQMCVVRSYLRLRDTLSKDCNSLVQRMQDYAEHFAFRSGFAGPELKLAGALVDVDPATGRVHVQGGATWADADRETQWIQP